MSYIGSTPTTQSFIAGTDYFNGNGSTVNFTLSRSVNSVNDIEVIVNNVEQIPSGYSVSGTTLTFSAAPSAGTSNVYVRYLSTTNLSLAIPAGTSATFNTVTATNLTVTNDATINGVKVGEGGGSVATNTAVGTSVLNANTTGSANTAIGGTALSANTTGANNVAVGYNSASANTTGTDNVAVGYNSLSTNLVGSNNTAIGRRALFTTTASDNTAVGYYALTYTTTGTANTAVGRDALQANTTANDNVAVGYQAAYTNTVGGQNICIGRAAGYTHNNGDGNVFIGYQAGTATTGSFNSTFVGRGAGSAMTGGTKNVIIGTYSGNQGSLDIRTASNYIVLSDGDGNPRCWWNNYGAFTNVISGSTALNYGTQPVSQFVNSNVSSYTLVVANANASPAYQYVQDIQFSGSTPNNTNARFLACTDTTNEKAAILSTGGFLSRNNSYGTYSDIKLKENVVDASPKLDDVMRLQVRNFNFKTNPEAKQIGFIAQEFEQVFPAMVDESQDRGKDGAVLDETTKSIKTSVLIPILVKAIQEQQALITTLTTRITALENNNATQ